MTTTGIKGKIKNDYNETDVVKQQRAFDSISDIDVQAMNTLKKGSAQSVQGPEKIQIPRIKELESLKESLYSVDLEETINDMFTVMKNMEYQLKSVLKINTSLEQDLKDSKEIISNLNSVKSDLSAKVAKMKEELPAKRELQIEVDYHIDERNKAEVKIRDLKAKLDKLQKHIGHSQERSSGLEEQRVDYINEINFLETRIHTDAEQIREYQKNVSVLKGKLLVNQEKIKNLENDLKESVDEKYSLVNELKASRAAVRELHSSLTDTKLQAKKTFYKQQNSSDDSEE